MASFNIQFSYRDTGEKEFEQDFKTCLDLFLKVLGVAYQIQCNYNTVHIEEL